jgi:para-aminobenzoate synthetase/4-amino-4-deoxychorismate lyase
VTGVPKEEAMELITATEDTPRGVYCGAIGFLAPSGDADFNVAVRTVVVDDQEGVAEFGVGTPITNRSDAVGAYEEARLKAKVLVERRPDFKLKQEFRCRNGIPGHIEETLAGLRASARYFGYAIDDVAVRAALHTAAATSKGDGALTLLLDRGGAITADVVAAPRWHEGPGDPDLIVGVVAADPVSSDNVYLFHNTTNCRVSEAMRRRYPDAEVVIVCNERDEVAGAVKGNIVALIDDRWVTPMVGCGTWPTAYRDRLLAANKIIERVISRDEIRTAAHIGVLDDIHGWRGVALLEADGTDA